MQSVSIGFSPCPNDTFIFDAIVNQRIDSGMDWSPELMDVEALNQLAMRGELDVTKISVASYPRVSSHYQILSAGAALGFGCGPLLISAKPVDLKKSGSLSVAIPGRFTTANLLLSIFFPDLTDKREHVFSDIENAVINGECDLGLIIHENRFTYEQKGLKKVADLGELWESRYDLPIPLGCIVVRREWSREAKVAVDKAIRDSVSSAFANPAASAHYIRRHAQEMSEEVQRRHIELYVNQFSVDLGEEGRQAVRFLLQEGNRVGLLPKAEEPVFINE